MKKNYISQTHFISKHFFSALLVLALLVFGGGSVSGATYYSAGNDAPNLVASWWTNTNGTGSHPANFTTAGNVFVIQSGHTMTTTANWTVSGAGSTIQINTGGTLVASNTITTIVMTVDGTYQHNINGGTIPTATWNSGSTCLISGYTNPGNGTTPAGIGQSFSNFTWNCPAQSDRMIPYAAGMQVRDNFNIISTGNDYLYFADGSNITASFLGNFIQSGGEIRLTRGNNNASISFAGGLTVSGGTLNIDGGNGGSILNIAGNISLSGGTLTESGSGSGAINFNGTTPQAYSKTGGTISNTVNFTVNSGATLDVGSSIIDGSSGTFTLNSGASITTAHAQGLSTTASTGSIQVTGIRTYSTGANYTYNANGNQAIGNGLIGANNLTLSGSGTKTFTTATTISNTFTNNSVIANLGLGLIHTANAYYLGTIQQVSGSWGGTGSAATNINTTNFAAATGILNVTTGPCTSGSWKGTTSTDWNTASNWCDGTVPTATTNVTIPASAPRQPNIGTAGGLCNNITIGAGASLTTSDGSSLTVSGNFTNNGTYTYNSGSVIFNGSTAQSIGGSTSTTFYNLTMLNTGTAGNNTVTLNQPITIADKGTFLLASGNIVTSSTNLLTINNPVNSAIMGGSASSYINGPVKWILSYSGSATSSPYTIPVGKTSYLPFTIKGFIPSWQPYLYLEAFNATSGGSPDASLTSLSSNEYWKLTTLTIDTYLDFSASSVSLGKATGIYPYDAIACLATNTNSSIGTYKSLGGTTNFYEVTNSAAISPSSTGLSYHYFTLGGTTTPKINIAPPLLGGFAYTVNFGPSAEQTFTVNGTSLSTGITINAPTDFEISLTSGTGFQNTITLPAVSNKVASTTVYLRLKAGLAVGTYPSENVTLSSTGATSVQITCNGTVFANTPTITTSGGRLCPPNASQVQLSSTASNINILYWSGPNNFYSQNDILINPADATYNGTYTVTGTIPTGANLLINGDFEAGNAGFLSSYNYINVVAAGTNNTNEGIYAVIANPQWLHNGFSTSPDHTPDPGTKQMVINGATTANVTVWSETVKVVPNSTYQFSYWLQSVVDGNPSIIQLYANNQPVGTPFTAIQTVGNYKQYYYNWNSGSSTSVTLDLRNMNTIGGGNDFAIDDIDFRTVTYVSSSLTVSASTAAAVSISTSTTTVAAGSNVSYTATPTNGGTAPLYQWYVNGVAVGTNTSSSTFNYVPNNGDVITCILTSNNTCTSPLTATSNAITMTVNGNKNYWLGASGTGGTVWSDPTNWTGGKVPASGDNIEFATTGNNAGTAAINDLYVDYNRVVGSIINNASGKNLIIPANKEVLVNNLITLTPVNAGSTYNQIQIKADPALPNGSLIFPNATGVNGTVEMYSKAYINSAATDGTQMYFWQYFGIPVESIKADPTLYGAYVRKSNEAGDYTDANYYWTELTNSSTLNAFDGFEICQPTATTYTFTGQLVNRNLSINPLQYSTGTNVIYPGENLLANPYTAAINVNKITFGTNVEASVYLYNTGSYGQWNAATSLGDNPGQYQSIPKLPAGNNGLPQEVPSMSSMLVKATAVSNGGISFNYSDVIKKNETMQRVKAADAASSTDLISTMIDLIGQHYSDRMWIFTEPSCSRNFDNGWDGRKILGSSLAPQIYAIEPDGDYQVNSVSDMNNTDLAFQAGDEVEYTLKFTHENIQRQYAGVYLVDWVENKTVDISQSGSTYTFAAEQTDAPAKRFTIITRYYEKNAPDTESQLKVFSAKNSAFIQNSGTFNGNCTLYNVAGQTIRKLSFAPNSTTAVTNLMQGAYVLSASTTNGEKVSKRIIVQ